MTKSGETTKPPPLIPPRKGEGKYDAQCWWSCCLYGTIRALRHECNAYRSRHIEGHLGIISLRMGLKGKRLAEFFRIGHVLRQCGEVERLRAAGPLAAFIFTLRDPRVAGRGAAGIRQEHDERAKRYPFG